MPLTNLCVSAILTPFPLLQWRLTLSARVLTGRVIGDSYVFGDTTALSVLGYFSFTPCSDLGGCGSGT